MLEEAPHLARRLRRWANVGRRASRGRSCRMPAPSRDQRDRARVQCEWPVTSRVGSFRRTPNGWHRRPTPPRGPAPRSICFGNCGRSASATYGCAGIATGAAIAIRPRRNLRTRGPERIIHAKIAIWHERARVEAQVLGAVVLLAAHVPARRAHAKRRIVAAHLHVDRKVERRAIAARIETERVAVVPTCAACLTTCE